MSNSPPLSPEHAGVFSSRPKRSIFCLSTRRQCILNSCDAEWLSIEDRKIDTESIGHDRLSRHSRVCFCARRSEDHTGTAFLDGQERAAGGTMSPLRSVGSQPAC